MDVTQPGIAQHLAETLKTAIDNNSAADNPPKFSWRVSPSSLGDECVARQWFKFRWATSIQKPGRINRLFKRGNGREDYFTALLRREGWKVRDYAKRLCYHAESDSYIAQPWELSVEPPLDDVSEIPWHIAEAFRRDKWLLQQYKVTDFDGHMSGYFDGQGMHPDYTDNQWIMLEYKTYSTKRFVALCKAGVQKNDYEYYVQVQLGLKKLNLPWCLFLAENKNDDDIYPEVILRDEATADRHLTTAHTIITSKARPARFAQTPAHHVCKTCDYVGVCHKNETPARNCRSCIHATAAEKGKFRCEKWNAIIPGEKEMLAACPQHEPITNQ